MLDESERMWVTRIFPGGEIRAGGHLDVLHDIIHAVEVAESRGEWRNVTIDVDGDGDGIPSIFVRGERPETDEEVRQRCDYAARIRAGQEKWERSQYEQLKAKFEPKKED